MASPSPSKKNVFDIKSKILQPALTSHFQCWFNPPVDVQNWLKERQKAGVGVAYDNNYAEIYSLLCCETSLPGSSLTTLEINNDFTGVTERHAYRRIYDDRIDFTFYVDHDYNIIKFFENWIGYIVNEQFTDERGVKNNAIELSNYSYKVRYPNGTGRSARSNQSGSGYRTEVYLNKFERDYSGRYIRYRFLQAYPISIQSMPVSYDSSSLLKCTVSFTYSRYLTTGEFNDEPKENLFDSITPKQAAAINASAYNPNLNLGIDYAKYNTTGGVNYAAAFASGNSINITPEFNDY
jgi:hypothetical protein